MPKFCVDYDDMSPDRRACFENADKNVAIHKLRLQQFNKELQKFYAQRDTALAMAPNDEQRKLAKILLDDMERKMLREQSFFSISIKLEYWLADVLSDMWAVTKEHYRQMNRDGP